MNRENFLVALLCVGLLAGCDLDASGEKTDVAPEPAASVPQSPPEPRQPSLLERLNAATDIGEAVKILRPVMDDTRGEELPKGAAALAVWAHKNANAESIFYWPDSRLADVVKDPQGYRGLKLCSSGTVVEIHTDRSMTPPVYNGGLMRNDGNVVRFIALGSTEGIVADSQASFCGIFTGMQSYPNSVGGVTHAAFVVGWFHPIN